jgi:hypothetical protein
VGHSYSYESALKIAERVAFRLDDVLAPEAEFDFGQPFLPDALAGCDSIPWLAPDERLTLNHIRGYSYLCLFGLVEEFILPFVMDHARADLGGDDARTRALLGFASEEAKHIELFKRFRSRFERGFGTQCEVIGPASAIARAVLGHGPLGVSLLILHIEWMTQRHFVGAFALDPAVKPGAEKISYTVRVKGSGTREQFEAVHAQMMTMSPNRFHLTSPIPLESRLVVE